MLNKLAMIDAPDGEFWTLVRFKERVTESMYLVECLNPQDGEPNKMGSYFLDVHLLMLQQGEEHARAKVFKDFAAVLAFLDWVEEPPAEKVVKLVKP